MGPLQAEHSISKARAGLIAAGFGCGAMATVKIAETMLSAGVHVLELLHTKII